MDKSHRPLKRMLGAQVRALRTALGMKPSDLAAAAGLSPGMLSTVENGATPASLTTLQAIAPALNMPLASLFTRFDAKSEATFVKAGQELTSERRDSAKGHRYQLLGHGLRPEVGVEPYLITLDEDSDPYPIFQRAGIEYLYVLKGAVLYVHGYRSYAMEPGDPLFFDAGVPHGPMELRRLPAVYLSIIVTPAAGG